MGRIIRAELRKSVLLMATVCGPLRPGYEAAVSTRARKLEYTNQNSNQKLGLRQFGFSAGDLFKKHKRKPNLIMSLF